MKRVVKRRNNKKVTSRKNKLVFIVLFLVYFISSTFLKNYNVDLDHKYQTLINENEKLVQNNQNLSLKIDELSSFERMSSIAKASGLENREGSIKNVR